MPAKFHQRIKAELDALSQFPEVRGCALVEIDTGMVWLHSGSADGFDQVGEVAVEFWRTHQRHASAFASLGGLRISVFFFGNATLALLPCPGATPLILVCLAARSGMNWNSWMNQVKPLHAILLAGQDAFNAT